MTLSSGESARATDWPAAMPARRLGPGPGAAEVLGVVLAVLSAVLLAALGPRWAAAQANYKPLERGDFVEEEEVVHVLKGVEASLDYAIQFADLSANDLPGEDEETKFIQDIRLGLTTAFHRDVALKLVLEPFPEPLSDGNIRREPRTERGRIAESQEIGINAREAYLRYNFNPRSGMLFGKQELSLADRRGKLFNAIVPAVTFDCEVGTWCMPFGAAKLNEGTADWLYHWALEYTAWDDAQPVLRSSLEVEIFRLWYTEKDVPLGKNNGPTYASEDPLIANFTQATDDAGNPIYYDVHGHTVFGFRLNWEAGSFFWNFDWITSQGSRIYHRFRVPGQGIGGEMQFTSREDLRRQRKKINGFAIESEIGLRGPLSHIGVRYMFADGDKSRPTGDGRDFLRGLGGFYELTPGSYRGTRLYFNGFDSEVDQGMGLGHSINNTILLGLFWEIDDPDGEKIGYRGGIYDLRHVHAVLDARGDKQRLIGVEWDNMLILYWHKALQAQLEVNLFLQEPAFSYDDFTPPDTAEEGILQIIGRIVYQF